MWEFLKFWRRPVQPPVASIGWRASPKALRHMIELLPDHPRIGVIDDHRMLIGVIEVDKVLLNELDDTPAIIVADLI